LTLARPSFRSGLSHGQDGPRSQDPLPNHPVQWQTTKIQGRPSIASVVKELNLNKELHAKKMGMPAGTFKNKLSEIQTAYRFTNEERAKLHSILKELGVDCRRLR